MIMTNQDRKDLFNRYWKIRDRAHKYNLWNNEDTLTMKVIRNLESLFSRDDDSRWVEMPPQKKMEVTQLAIAYNISAWQDDGREDYHWNIFADAAGIASHYIYTKLMADGELPYDRP